MPTLAHKLLVCRVIEQIISGHKNFLFSCSVAAHKHGYLYMF